MPTPRLSWRIASTDLSRPGSGGRRAAGRDLQRQAWQWADANRTGDGSLPSGREIALQYGRHERGGDSSNGLVWLASSPAASPICAGSAMRLR
jgi:hypothetical protein